MMQDQQWLVSKDASDPSLVCAELLDDVAVHRDEVESTGSGIVLLEVF